MTGSKGTGWDPTPRAALPAPQHGDALAKCPLLKGVNAKFIDALLCAATIETYMPRVDILADGGGRGGGAWGGLIPGGRRGVDS
jgi:hypothetical protein